MAWDFGDNYTVAGRVTHNRDHATIWPGSQLSIACWFYLDSAGFDSRLLSIEDGNGQDLNLVARYSSGSDELRFHIVDQFANTGDWRIASVALDTWHHLILTYDYGAAANDPVIYLNNASQTLTTDSNPGAAVTPPGSGSGFNVTWGNNVGRSRGLEGAMTGCGVWNTILSAGNRTDLFTNKLSPDNVASANLVQCLNMEATPPANFQYTDPKTSIIWYTDTNGDGTGTATLTGLVAGPAGYPASPGGTYVFGVHT